MNFGADLVWYKLNLKDDFGREGSSSFESNPRRLWSRCRKRKRRRVRQRQRWGQPGQPRHHPVNILCRRSVQVQSKLTGRCPKVWILEEDNEVESLLAMNATFELLYDILKNALEGLGTIAGVCPSVTKK